MSSKINVAINGFGRIGRNLCRILLDHPLLNLVVINDLADAKTLAHLLKYDSIHGVSSKNVSFDDQHIIVNDQYIPVLAVKQPSDCPWDKYNVQVVVESTGKFKNLAELEGHLKTGVQKVILSAPPPDDSIKTVVLGVNEAIIAPTDRIISNASCTTNNAAPMIQVINDLCGIEQAYITTIHSYTTDQSLHDQPHRDLRRARAAGQSIIPTTTGAAKALTKIFPEFKEVIGGCGIRVPVPNGSLTDITFNVKNPATIETINNAFLQASQHQLKNILSYTEDPIVSIDIRGNTHSCIFDSLMTSSIGNMVKIIGWYDNETGYSHRLIDLILMICKK
ncbi:type I glyceraldehyde-3-phosphate dehydrogenase [Aquimarina sp. ERC-38]|uniref:type I glyceraldehyde-3-phosphate dehydrogenase n=1 Tax=Aquimarina sp. ERC-38 TaxID=2949996 RepID=UPI0022469261|nr:type I glyceraldehyde-3-phosphate dehydrogenase [Aquimarina sp. ERC-38]UZO80581.1 type I glyceraldehyde-3-phosphate dehydrogenase [Aquimarina sp. ERC-38]